MCGYGFDVDCFGFEVDYGGLYVMVVDVVEGGSIGSGGWVDGGWYG